MLLVGSIEKRENVASSFRKLAINLVKWIVREIMANIYITGGKKAGRDKGEQRSHLQQATIFNDLDLYESFSCPSLLRSIAASVKYGGFCSAGFTRARYF